MSRQDNVLTTSISEDCSYVVYGDLDGKVSMLNARTGKRLWTVKREGMVLTTSISPDGAHVVCGATTARCPC